MLIYYTMFGKISVYTQLKPKINMHTNVYTQGLDWK